MTGGVSNTNIARNVPRLPNSSANYWGGKSIWTHPCGPQPAPHTGNTRQHEPQFKSSLCSSAIPSHNSRDAIPNHNSRNTTCLTPILSHNSRDTFWGTTQGTLASRLWDIIKVL